MTLTAPEATNGGASVRLIGLSRVYGGQSVVDDVHLEARSGEVLALLGPSGCGKTTTLRMIAGLVQPSAGDIRIDDRSVVGLPAHKRNLGMLFQNYALFPHMTVLENVAFGLSMRGVGKAETERRARLALDRARLPGFETRMPAELSGGQQQRVALARALVYQPRVLLLDEPFAALDKKLREAMHVELRQLCAEVGLTTIIVTHDQEEALVLADRIAVMRGGRIEQAAAARTIYERPTSHFVADFIGTSNFMAAAIVDTAGGLIRMRADDGRMFESAIVSDLTPADRIAVAVRPESIRLTPGATEPAPNRIVGRVARTVFKGQTVSVWLDIGAGRDWIATLSAAEAGAKGLEPGGIWTAAWSADHTLVVREQ